MPLNTLNSLKTLGIKAMKNPAEISILVACEREDEVRSRFAAMGFDAWSCDLEASANPDNKKHIRGDVFGVIASKKWDVMIAFPPCFESANAPGTQTS